MDTVGAPRLHENEPHGNDIAHRLNWLRAGVLGANDGIVSVAAIVVGVAGATTQTGPILIAGAAGVVGGAISMALGEYVSVSSQSDSQKALIEKERRELEEEPEEELAELAAIYQSKGLSHDTAQAVARELTAHDALSAHLSAELNIDQEDIVSPWHAAVASAIAFVAGAVLPMLAILLPPENIRVPLTFAAVLVVIGGALALAATFAIGSLLGATGVV
jgi:VIT1/CCC1 family predicted Fe2+/Mn2+ transporter